MKCFFRFSLLVIFISLLSCSENNDKEKLTVKILPGYGAIIENDTIVLGRTSIEELKEKFRLDTLREPSGFLWDGIDSNGKDVGGYAYGAKFHFKNIHFTYESEIALDSIELSSIFINPLESSNVMLDSINLNEKNIDIDRIFPIRHKLDKVGFDSLSYRLFSYGIILSLLKKEDDFYIKSISIFPKFI